MQPVLYIVIPCYNEQEVLPITAPMFLEKIKTLTEKGKEIAAAVCRRVEDVVSVAEKNLPPELREPVFRALDLIADDLNAIQIENVE